MFSRRRLLRSLTLIPVLSVAAGSATACAARALMSNLQVSQSTIEPNGTGLHGEADLSFTLNRRAEVSATLIGPDGKQFVLRAPQMRTPDAYQIQFKGVVPVPGKSWQRVVPDGTYTVRIQAREPNGAEVVKDARITVKGADTNPPQIADLLVNPATFSPNGDGIDDTCQISFRITKAADVRVYATDSAGGFYLIQAPTKSIAKAFSITWDGSGGGGAVLKDGSYVVHVEATDTAGNFTDATTPVRIENGGTPRASIVDVRFSPAALATGMDLKVSITLKNTGQVPLSTWGPPPSQKYTTSQTFSTFVDPKKPNTPLWFAKPGVWRVCVDWQNSAGGYPVRWGLFEDLNRKLMPGETVTVEGTITVLLTLEQSSVIFWAALEQGGVGFVDTQSGQKSIVISH